MDYNTAPAFYHNENGTIESVTIQDAYPGKSGFTGIIHENGEHEFVEDWQLVWYNHDKDTCEVCEELQ